MDSKSANLSDFAVPEYLPENKLHVDLLQPERMSQAQLLELFTRRGFGSLVSSQDPLHRLVDLYYDHIMPIPPTPDSVHSVTNNAENNTAKSATPTPVVAKSTGRLPIPPTKKPPTTRLEDLVITSDPRRSTPGYATPEANRAERVLSVRPPKGITSSSLNDKATNSTIPGASSCMKRSSNNQSPPTPGADAEPVVKKRVKLKRDFTNLA